MENNSVQINNIELSYIEGDSYSEPKPTSYPQVSDNDVINITTPLETIIEDEGLEQQEEVQQIPQNNPVTNPTTYEKIKNTINCNKIKSAACVLFGLSICVIIRRITRRS